MDRDQEKKHVCKLCNKSFLSGRILGGHMRVHVVEAKDSVEEEIGVEENNMGMEGYGLRENRRKSWKFSGFKHDGDDDDDSTDSVEIIKCEVCGKQFGSPRSLHGHMRHCSVKGRKGVCCKECGKWFKTLRSLTGHMRLHSVKYGVSTRESTTSSSRPNLVVMALSESGTGTVSLVRKKRSIRTRYKITPNSSLSSLNESVSGFEVEQEVEEVAMSLMMLSRARTISDCADFKSVSEIFDNGSVSSGDESLLQNKRNQTSEGVFEGDEIGKKKKSRNLEPFVSDSKDMNYECGELELPIGRFYEEIFSKKIKLEESEFLLCDTKIKKGFLDEIDSNQIESESTQEVELGTFDAELGKDSCTEIICSSSTTHNDDVNDCKKKSQFQCRICNKIFLTHQALGGHQTFHRTRNSANLKIEQWHGDIQTKCLPENFEPKESVEEEQVSVYQSKKSKKYQCNICSKYFFSGQALGGHKRAHHSKPKEEQDMAIEEEDHNSNICSAIDINLNDMPEEENGREIGFKPCWDVSSYNHDSLLNVIAN